MADQKRSKKQKPAASKTTRALQEILSLQAKLTDLKKEMDRASEDGERAEDRLTEMEAHVTLLARLLTTLCIENLGIRTGALKRLVQRVEKEAVRDSQIMELESLYRLSRENLKKTPLTRPDPKNDPWEQIS